ncbi:putative cytosine/adenosine deaminase (modular protein) [Bradyrhizobium sp. ORS 375]|uniref:nucleoside deaminase n=1 Tax=Bradyrhizobium sp. (strain ORS 375) TaxID=566679 RepID=UPI00024059AC|nr:nucleoside deaminase [Bradyrhizobium sp. ORS 375]CCD96189.1 putative cytosine/adenosine deaminase (modular protein) [Bradyrhizobium sp. ORS 375]
MTTDQDAAMMRRCLALASSARARGEVPYAAVIGRNGRMVCESINRANADRDVTQHAELVAISQAQKALGTSSLDDCTLYTLVEPCPMCAYAMREVRIGRVVYGLGSPVMGGHSRWNILGDDGLSSRMPEVFATPPDIVAGFFTHEAAAVMQAWNPLFWTFVELRDLIRADVLHGTKRGRKRSLAAASLRWMVDRLWRR